MKAGYGKAGKQKTLSNFPTATTTTNYNYLWDTDSEGKVTLAACQFESKTPKDFYRAQAANTPLSESPRATMLKCTLIAKIQTAHSLPELIFITTFSRFRITM